MDNILKALFKFLWKYRHEIAGIVYPLLQKLLKRMKDARDRKKAEGKNGKN